MMKSHRWMIVAAATLAAGAWVGVADADNLTAGDTYVVDLAFSGMPVSLTFAQHQLAQAQMATFEDFNTPGQLYLDAVASTGWRPAGGNAAAAPVTNAFTTPGGGYLHSLDLAGWQPPGSSLGTVDMTTPGHLYLRTLADAGWDPAGLQSGMMIGFRSVHRASRLASRW